MTLSEPFQNTLIWSIFARVPKEQDRRPEGTKRIEQSKDYSDKGMKILESFQKGLKVT